MERFSTQRSRRRPPGWLMILLLGLLAVGLFSNALTGLSTSASQNQRQILEDAIQRSIIRCYAIEGAYPEDLSYLRTQYGLSYDEGQFFVDYRITGANVFPDVTVIERKEANP